MLSGVVLCISGKGRPRLIGSDVITLGCWVVTQHAKWSCFVYFREGKTSAHWIRCYNPGVLGGYPAC